MNKINILIITCAAIISFAIVIAIFFIIFIMYKKNIRDKYKKIIGDMIDKISIKVIQNKLIRIEIIADNNSKYRDIFSKLANDYEKINLKYETILDDFQEFCVMPKNSSISKLKDEINKICNDLKNLDTHSSYLHAEINKIIEPDEFLLKEILFYRSRHKMICTIFQKKAIQINSISHSLIFMNNKIIELSKQFEKNHGKGKIVECSDIISKYRKTILDFAHILNEAPVIGNYIYNRIPNLIKKLQGKYSNIIKNEKLNIQYIDFAIILKKIHKKYENLKLEYENLNITICKKNIIQIIKNIKWVERSIENEITAKKIIAQNYKKYLSETKIVFKKFNDINKQLNILKENNKIEREEENLQTDAISLVEEIKNRAIKLDTQINSIKIPNTSKISKLKNILLLELKLIEKLDNLLTKITTIKNFKLHFINRFNYASEVITFLNAEINENDIILTDNEKNQLMDADQIIFELEKNLNAEQLDKELILKNFEKIESRIIWINKIIGTKKEAAKITKNLMAHFASKRKYNMNLNRKMDIAERNYLSGKYIEALNVIISGLESINE